MASRSQRAPVFVACAISLLIATPVAGAGFDDPAADSPDATVYQPAFADVPDGHLFESEVRALLASEVTLGCNPPANTRFCPDRPVTRGEMAAFLTRAMDLPDQHTTNFTDDEQHVFEDDIERLAAAGITRGCDPPANTRFCPDRPVTRGEMAAFLTRAMDLAVPDAVPEGVRLERTESQASGRGTVLTVCRDTEMSLVVRTSTSSVPGLGNAHLWEPTHLDPPAGEVDLATDRWFLPRGSGCETLDIAWDPRVNPVAPPLDSVEVVSAFGYRHHPILGDLRLHEGADLEAESGDLVSASSAGVVVHAGLRGGYGNLVEVQHIGGLSTRYAHLERIDVAVGDPVVAGDVVGTIGCTGLCTAPHLHFETREFDVAVDPMSYLAESPG
jgi:hypothetical protein